MENDLVDFSDDPLEDQQIWSDLVDNLGPYDSRQSSPMVKILSEMARAQTGCQAPDLPPISVSLTIVASPWHGFQSPHGEDSGTCGFRDLSGQGNHPLHTVMLRKFTLTQIPIPHAFSSADQHT